MNRTEGLSLVIQAGGESLRMGQNKALLPFRGQPLVQRLIERLGPAAEETIVTTNQPDAFAGFGVRLAGDLLPGLGALSGLYTALHAARCPLVAVVACDMPFASPLLLAHQAALLADSAWAAVVPRSDQGLEPFHAVYRREICLPLVEAALQAEKRRVDAWFAGAKIYFLLPEETRLYDPAGLAFINVNTPAEFAEAEALET